MNVREAQEHWQRLRQALEQGRMTRAAYDAAVAHLRVQDAKGRWWQADPARGSWMLWDGARWEPGTPEPEGPEPRPPATTPATAPASPPALPVPEDPVARAFREGEAAAAPLRAQAAAGRMGPEVLQAALSRIRVQDAQGRLWQPDPFRPGWIVWDGSQWQPAMPPQGATFAAASPLAALQQKLMDPKTFLEVARRVPLGQRPQGWWDLLSIFAGAGSGWLWFVYGSVRGFPYPAFLSGIKREQWTDFLPAFGLLLVPVLLILARRTVAKLVSPLFSAIQSIPLPVKLFVGIGFAGFVWLVTTPNPLLSRFINYREGLDWITPVLMTALPMGFVFLRRELDQLLQPFQAIKQHIPKLVLLGIGIALPFLTAWFMYRLLGISQYPLLRINTVVGLVLSYLVVRTPQSWPDARRPALPRGVGTALILLALAALASTPGFADDFLRDPFNLQDGLRTDGIAPVLAGVSTAVVSIFVNGVEVGRVLIQSTTPVGEGEEVVHKQFTVQVRTVGEDGAPSTSLDAQNPTVFIYAHCEEVGKGRFPAGDDTIQFAQGSAEGWVTVQDLGTQYGERCAAVRKADTEPGGPPPTSCLVTVSAGAGGGLISAPVTLSVEFSSLEIRWAVEPAKYRTEERITVPAKQGTEVSLNLWAVKHEADGSETVDWDVDFTHMQMSEPDGVPAAVFGMRDEPAAGRQEQTVWIVKENLPCSVFPKEAPAACGIRVRVWSPQGRIVRHGFSRIEPNGAKQRGEITIPVLLEDPPAKLELVSPEMPIPADEANARGGVELRLRLTAQYAEGPEPLKDAEIHWALAAKSEKPPLGGRFDVESGRTDERGEIALTYYPPELFYKPGGHYFEDLEVFRGAPGATKAPKKLGDARLLLAPAFRFKLTPKKERKLEEGDFGVLFEATEVDIPADECATAILVTPRLEWAAAGGGDGHANLAHTELAFTFWDGKADVPEQPATPFKTPAEGTLRRAFPELSRHGSKEYTLEADTEAPLGTLNPMAETLLDQYEENLERWCPLSLLSASVASGLKAFRDDFAKNLAALPPEQFDKLYASVRLLECAATHTHIYNELYANMVKVAIDQGVKIIGALVGMLISYFNVGEKVLGFIGKKLAEKGKGFTGWVWNTIGARLRSGLTRIGLWLNCQIPKLRLTGSPKNPSLFDQFIARMEAEANRLAPMLDLDSPMFVQGLLGYFKLLIHYMAGYFMYAAGHILLRTSTRIVARVSGMLFLQGARDNLENVLGKVIEDKLGQAFNGVCDSTVGAVTSAGAATPPGHGDLARSLNFLAPALDGVLTRVLAQARKAQVPAEYKPRLEAMKQGLTELRGYSHSTELDVIESDLNTEWWDWVVWAVDWFLIAVASLCSLGLASAQAASATRAIDIAWGLLQAAMRAYGSFGTTLGLSTGIIAHFELQTLDLVDLQP